MLSMVSKSISNRLINYISTPSGNRRLLLQDFHNQELPGKREGSCILEHYKSLGDLLMQILTIGGEPNSKGVFSSTHRLVKCSGYGPNLLCSSRGKFLPKPLTGRRRREELPEIIPNPLSYGKNNVCSASSVFIFSLLNAGQRISSQE